MEKMLITILGIAFLSVLSNAQDIGRMRRMMLMRQRELALRRAAFPFGPTGIGGPGIPPPVAARLAILQRQRALSNPFIRSRLGPLGSPFSPFSPSRALFGLRGPFTPGLAFPGPADISRFDLSTLGISGPTDGFGVVSTNGLTPVGPGGPVGSSVPQGGSGNIFGQQPSQAAEFLEATRGTVEARSGPDMRSSGQPARPPPRPGFRPRDSGPRPPRAEAQRMQRPSPDGPSGARRTSQQTPEDRFQSPRITPPHLAPPLAPPLLSPRDVIFPFPPPQGQSPLEPRFPPLSHRRRGRNQQRSRRPPRPRRGRRPQGSRVFPNVPEVVQIPAVAPGTQGQSMGGQLTQTGATQSGGGMVGQQGGAMVGQQGGAMVGQMGGPMVGQAGGPMLGQPGGPVTGPFGRSVSGPFGGQMRGPFPGPMQGPMPGPTFSFAQPSGSGQFSTGFQSRNAQGSAIFPSQATQGPILRQRGPGFTTDSSFTTGLEFTSPSTVLPGFPNGPAFRFGEGVPGFGPSDQFIFPTGGLSPDVFTNGEFPSTGFTGFPGASFGPGVDSSTSGGSAVTSQSAGGVPSQFSPNFGFVGPSNNAAAGPAFNAGPSSSAQNFNIQFRPLQPAPQVPQIPEQRPNPSQMGIGAGVTDVQVNTGVNTGISSQGGLQFGNGNINNIEERFSPASTQNGLIFDGSLQTGTAGQNSKFTNTGSTTVIETNTNQQAGGASLATTGTQNLDSAAATVSDRTVQTGASDTSGANTEFRIVEVGNILGNNGFVNSGASAGVSGGSVVKMDGGIQQGSGFQPVGDINAAFQSFGAVDGTENVVDLSLQPEVGTGTGSTSGQSGSMEAAVTKTFTTGDTSGSTTATNSSESNSVVSFQDGPFVPPINQDFSFFISENTQAPNEMPPITFNAPEPPVFGPDGTTILTFPVEGTGGSGPGLESSNMSQSGFSLDTNTVTSTGTKTSTGPVQPDTNVVEGATNTATGGFL